MNSNKKIIKVLVVISLMFLALVTYLLLFNVFQASEVKENPYNARNLEEERNVKRGSIYDMNGVLLAETEVDGDARERKYPYTNLYSHVIGYCNQAYGKSQLERTYSDALLGKGDLSLSFGNMKIGNDLVLSINHELQKYAKGQLDGREGAVVALDPKTGGVLALVSYPDFDPSADAMDKNWQTLVEERDDSPLLARATQGLYAPGSTYKIVTADAAYNYGMTDRTFEDNGELQLGGATLTNAGGASYGTIGLEKAFKVSSNIVFATIGMELGHEKVMTEAESFGINKDIKFDIPLEKSTIDSKGFDNAQAGLVSIGQGKLLMTPLHLAMICGAIANGGKMMQPYLVSKIVNSNGDVVSQTKPKELFTATGASSAQYIKDLMVETVKSGTATSAQVSGITVAGKTGTAENERGIDHSWFVGFAPADNPQIAVAVLLEYDGTSGGKSAAPIAANVIKKYLK